MMRTIDICDIPLRSHFVPDDKNPSLHTIIPINKLVYTSCGQNQKIRTSCGHPTKDNRLRIVYILIYCVGMVRNVGTWFYG